jgi:hypothetical protein
MINRVVTREGGLDYLLPGYEWDDALGNDVTPGRSRQDGTW